MDETTIKDIRQRVERWQKDCIKDGKESERTWIFAVNIDDVNLLLRTIDHLLDEQKQALEAFRVCNHLIETLRKENEDLRAQLFQAREQLAYAPSDGNPTGLEKYWFNDVSGPYKATDTFHERSFRYAHGPYETWDQANVEWKLFIRRQIANGGK